MNDWLGLAFCLLLTIGVYLALKRLANPPKNSESEFENRVGDGTGLMSAGVGALNELLNPNEAKAKEVKMQLKEGRFNKKKREGKGNGNL
jgi:hypothetical protein